MILLMLKMCIHFKQTTRCHPRFRSVVASPSYWSPWEQHLQQPTQVYLLQILYTQFSPSFLLLSPFSFVVIVVMFCIQCTLIDGFLLLIFRPLPLQLSEQIRSQQAVSHKATSQRAVHRLSWASLSPLTFAAGQLMTAASSTNDTPASPYL